MKYPPLKFFAGSLAIHLAAIGALSVPVSTEHGAAQLRQSGQHTQSFIQIRLAPVAKPAPNIIDKAQTARNENKRLPASGSIPDKRTLLPEETTASPAIEQPQDDFVSTGHLTRLPAPIGSIELSDLLLNPMGYIGELELGVLIDIDGHVIDVISSTDSPAAQEFAQRVADRFRQTRFSPGEINGRPVRSRLDAVVVSEGLSPETQHDAGH